MKQRMMMLLFIAACAIALASCGGSSTSTDSGGGGDNGNGGTTLSTAKAVPTDIVLASPTEETTAASGSLSRAFSVAKGDAPPDQPPPDNRKPGDPVDNSYMQKKEAFGELVSGSGDCSFTMQIPTIPPPNCYGPTVQYQNYPGGSGGQSQFPVGDLGFWNPTEGDTEACAAAKMNQLVRNVASRVDNMVNILGTAACAANKASVTLPAIGETLDLKTIATEKASVSGLTFDLATIKRLADTADGHEVYLSTISMTMSFPDGSTANGKLVLKHIPTSADGSTYKGKLSMRMGSTQMAMVNDCDPGVTGTTMAGVILYEKTAANDVKYEFNYVPLCGSDTDPFDANNNISPATTTWLHDWNYGVFNLNPENGAGSAAYAWQAGTGDKRTRVFNMSVSAGSDSSASGTAYYGFGHDIVTASSSTIGTIDGFVCNWAGPNGAVSRSAVEAKAEGKGWDKAQRQTLTRAAGATNFSVATSNMKYAPVNNCDTNDANFRYRAIASATDVTPLNMSNDRNDATEIINDLIPLTEIVFIQPTHPEDVGGGS